MFKLIVILILVNIISASDNIYSSSHKITSYSKNNSSKLISCLFNQCSDLGGPCDTGNNVNANGNRCYQPLKCIDGTCSNFVKKPNCTVNYDCDETKGEYCILEMNATDISVGCKLNDSDSTRGTCEITPPPSYRLCLSQKDCQPYEFCKCDRASSVGYCYTKSAAMSRMCEMANNLFMKCVSNKCPYIYNFHPNSCSSRLCPEETKYN
ncbi:hypothetical protein PPL_07250 [Heterostelium album PN500]|uniref:Uncharacterized protein n=1 Tax=Heterostelium pallidum (strain ATCC 26659 / Pp 5 / PN500) TaxID=670386 RepID=D3BET5_HETP5|nr:hypothetical protein PPL_07250 [Heterostelium album PN500]EFA80416.1 hypothetical protein PPL_07250 [Heterostelium album PN500]|eukprot:XP_020432536.1 hypothetical protein PPL_07250 [Heterostelium album PN500]